MCCEIWTTILYTDGDQVGIVKFIKKLLNTHIGVSLALGTHQWLQDGQDMMVFPGWIQVPFNAR